MMREARTWLVWLALALCATVAGCDAQQASGAVQAVLTLPQAVSASDVSRVELTVTAEGMTPRTQLLTRMGGQWGGLVENLPVGTGRTFRGEAFDPANTLIYAGQVTDVAIAEGQTTAVALIQALGGGWAARHG